MKEKECPFCLKPVRSDASTSKSCALCGMFIDNSETQYIYYTSLGETLYFCCERCRNTYFTEILNKTTENLTEIIDDIYEDLYIKQDRQNLCINYRLLVQTAIKPFKKTLNKTRKKSQRNNFMY
jgi:YHS domain-containing protein